MNFIDKSEFILIDNMFFLFSHRNESNAFEIELFVVLNDIKMIKELLTAVFQQYQCRRYCLLEMSSLQKICQYQSLLKYFMVNIFLHGIKNDTDTLEPHKKSLADY